MCSALQGYSFLLLSMCTGCQTVTTLNWWVLLLGMPLQGTCSWSEAMSWASCSSLPWRAFTGLIDTAASPARQKHHWPYQTVLHWKLLQRPDLKEAANAGGLAYSEKKKISSFHSAWVHRERIDGADWNKLFSKIFCHRVTRNTRCIISMEQTETSSSARCSAVTWRGRRAASYLCGY